MAKGSKAVEDDAILRPLHTGDERREIAEKLYEPLRPWDTRLLGLQPGEFHDPLAATLQIAVITHERGFGLLDEERSVRFKALSYTWGGEVLSHPLICNDVVIGITKNLATALRYLRHRRSVIYLWADAVCINQMNNLEKARQIRNLQMVFKRADKVIAWLGEEHQNTAVAVKALRKFPTSQYQDRLERTHDFRTWEKSLVLDEFVQVAAGLSDLAARPYLRRAWIVQELAAASRITFLCGFTAITWDEFRQIDDCLWSIVKAHKVLQRSYGLDSRTRYTFGSKTAIDFLVSVRGDRGEKDGSVSSPDTSHRSPANNLPSVGSFSKSEEAAFLHRGTIRFYELLKTSSHLVATDPRDKIWSLIGLSDLPVVYGASEQVDDEAFMLSIDYDKPVAQVYAEMTRFLLRWLTEPGFLFSFGPDSHCASPSWSLDFAAMQLPKRRCQYGHVFGRLEPVVHGEFPVRYTGWDVLSMKGWEIGKLCSSRLLENEDEFSSKLAPTQTSPHDPFLTEHTHTTESKVEIRVDPKLPDWILEEAMYASAMQAPSIYADWMRCDDWNDGVPTSYKTLTLRERQSWIVIGSAERNDIIALFAVLNCALVLRPLAGRRFSCVGRAICSQLFDMKRLDIIPFWQAARNRRLYDSSRVDGGGDDPGHEQTFDIC